MAGQIKKMIDIIMSYQSRKNQSLLEIVKTKLILRGINPDKYNEQSEDDPKILAKLQLFAQELNIDLEHSKLKAVTAYSTQQDEELAVKEIKDKIGNDDYKVIIFFASSSYDQEKLAKCMHSQFPHAQTIGASSQSELYGGKLQKNSIVAMGLCDEIIADIKVELIENLDQPGGVKKAFSGFEKHFGKKMFDLDFKKYAGLILMDGLSYEQEKIMAEIGMLTNVMFIGGASADNWELKATYQYLNGKAYSNSAILILIKPAVDFKVIKTQSFKPIGEAFTATRVDEKKRIVYEFNDKPAAEFYSQLINKPIEGIEQHFINNTLGIMIGDEPYIHDIRTLDKTDGSMYFYSSIPEGIELQLLKSGKIIAETEMVLENEVKALGSISALINFNCASRSKRLEIEELTPMHEEIFKDLPAIGFSTYGEYFIGLINQTSTMLIFR